MKNQINKYYTAQVIKAMILNENKMPKSTNPQNMKYSFIVEARGSIFGNAERKRVLR